MKIKHFYFCLLIFHVSLKAQTNIYHPFPEDNATWLVDNFSNVCSGYCNSSYYQMLGDTFIGNISYNKIYKRTGPFYYITPPSPWSPGVLGSNFDNCSYLGGLRQDSILKQVYFIDNNSSTEKLLCDFNLQVGDTMPNWYNQYQIGTLVVISIDSIYIGNNYKKKWIFNNNSTLSAFEVVEGMGWIGDLLGPLNSPDGEIYLACFNGQQLNAHYFDECMVNLNCASIIGNQEKQSLYNFSLSPNPMHQRAELRSNRLLNMANCVLFNAQGQMIKSMHGINGKSFWIENLNLAAGTYFIQLFEAQKLLHQQVILVQE